MTYPLIGNYGVNSEDVESRRPWVEGFVVREASRVASNWRSTETLDAYLKRNNIVGIEHIDTRALVRHIRDKGAMRPAISTVDLDAESLLQKVLASPPMENRELASAVTVSENLNIPPTRRKISIVAYDFGVKTNSLREFSKFGCRVTVVPADTSADKVLALKPDGIFLSNGPGDPSSMTAVVDEIKKIDGIKRADLRHLSRPSDSRPGLWRRDVQAQIRPPRRQPADQRSDTGKIEIASQTTALRSIAIRFRPTSRSRTST